MRLFVTLIAMFALVAPGCQQDADQVEISNALTQTVAALEAANWKALWAASDPEAQQHVLELHKTLHEALLQVGELYERSDQPIARAALGRDLIKGIPVGAEDAGPQLLSRLFTAGAIRLDEQARDGLASTRATIDGNSAVVHTAVGEVFTFGRADGQWRSRLVIDMLGRSRAVATLRESTVAVKAALETKRAAWASSRDPKQPQGVYNLVRYAMERTPVDAAVAYALLDSQAHDALLESLKTARQAQARIQRRTPKRQRDAAYSRLGIAMHVKADSDRALYEAWATTKTFVPPVSGTSLPVKVESEPETKTAVVITDSNQRITVVQSDDGGWRLADNAKAIRSALLEPARQALSKLGGSAD